MAPYTKLAVRSLGPTKAVTREEHAKIPTYVPNSPSRGTRKHGGLKTAPAPEWKQHGVCVVEKHSVDLFYGDGHDAAKTQRSNIAAKKVCARCPFEDTCLAYALNNGERWGVWGGLTPKERSRMLKAREALRVNRLRSSDTTSEQACGMLRAHTSDPRTAGNGRGSDQSPVEAPMPETVASLSTPVKSSRE